VLLTTQYFKKLHLFHQIGYALVFLHQIESLNNGLRSNAPNDASNETMSSKNQTRVSSFSSKKIYGLGYGPCVEIFTPNQKLLDKDLSG